MANTRMMIDRDGINSLSYEVVEVKKNFLFTEIQVDIGTPS